MTEHLRSDIEAHRGRQGQGVSTKTYGHLHEEDRAWFIADSFRWLVDQDRGEPMRAQKAHVCYACDRTIPVGEQYRRMRGGVARINREGPRGVLPEAPPGVDGLSPGSAQQSGARPPRPCRAGARTPRSRAADVSPSGAPWVRSANGQVDAGCGFGVPDRGTSPAPGAGRPAVVRSG